MSSSPTSAGLPGCEHLQPEPATGSPPAFLPVPRLRRSYGLRETGSECSLAHPSAPAPNARQLSPSPVGADRVEDREFRQLAYRCGRGSTE